MFLLIIYSKSRAKKKSTVLGPFSHDGGRKHSRIWIPIRQFEWTIPYAASREKMIVRFGSIMI